MSSSSELQNSSSMHKGPRTEVAAVEAVGLSSKPELEESSLEHKMSEPISDATVAASENSEQPAGACDQQEEIDLLGNGKVIKTIKSEGDGEYPKSGANVSVHYTGRLLDGTKFDSSLDRNTPFEFVLGAGRVIKGWEVAVASMKKGEKCTVRIAPDFAYGEAGAPPTIPANATLEFEIELLSYNTKREKWAMSCDEKLTAAQESREEGTSQFKSARFFEAAQAYQEAASLVDKLDDWPETSQPEARQLAIVSNLNLALCQLKLENWLEATIAASTVLMHDPNNTKALFRRGQARSRLDQFDVALQDLEAALSTIADQDCAEAAEIKRQISITKATHKANEQKVKAFYKRMF